MASPKHDEKEAALDRFRVAMKFSLWTWALYWPGGGILLLTGGLDALSIVVVVASFVSFILLLTTGALSTTSSRNMKEFFLERPLYLIAVVALLALLTPLLTSVATVGLVLFASVYLGGMVFAGVRLWQYYQLQDRPFMKSGVDQVFIALGLAGLTSFVIFLDTWLFVLGGGAVAGGSMAIVALCNWVNLLYPGLILLATRPIRDPLHKPRFFRRGDKEETPASASAKAKKVKAKA